VIEPFKGKTALPADVQKTLKHELMLLKNIFKQFLAENSDLIHIPKQSASRFVELEIGKLEDFINWMRNMKVSPKIIDDFQNRFMKEPVEKRLSHYDGLIQNVAEKLGKRVKPLKIMGGETLIHPEPYMEIFSSLVHVFRNAVDHGIELPEERSWCGKSEEGEIIITFAERADCYDLIIQDDGQGIDPEAIRKKLAKTHPSLDTAKQTDHEVIQNIFLPGFSSREQIGEFSGRGVGMDALREQVVKIGGSVEVYSEAGSGTRFVLVIPKLQLENTPVKVA
jgi:two-component system chemotaxis sensor kinase CheA